MLLSALPPTPPNEQRLLRVSPRLHRTPDPWPSYPGRALKPWPLAERAALAGGCHTVLLSGEEANRRKDKQKSVLMRMHEPMYVPPYLV